MPELSANSPVNWNFTAETNAQGFTYIKAYKMCWDKVAKKPKRAMRRHVGRLMPDDSIAMSEKFLVDHPQYADNNGSGALTNIPFSYVIRSQ